MLLTYFGTNGNILDRAFLDSQGQVGVDLTSWVSTEAVLTNPETGVITTLSGTGLSFSADGAPLAGTVSELSFELAGLEVAAISDVSWDLRDLDGALAGIETGSFAAMGALFSLSSGIVIDASGSTAGLNQSQFWFDLVPHLSEGLTVNGSAFDDALVGGAQDDVITPGGNGGYDLLIATPGDDLYDLRGAEGDDFYEFTYANVTGPITLELDANQIAAQITKASGSVDTLTGTRNAMLADGLSIAGTASDDSFTVTTLADGWLSLGGGAGNDSFTLTLTGPMRLFFNWSGAAEATQALVVDLETGLVSNDGFGGQDTITVDSGDALLELRATDQADSIAGSARDERFISQGGNDTIDGRGGFDQLRYDRNDISAAVVADLGTGTVTSSWNGTAFTDSLSNIEGIRGSRSFDDTLTGAAGAEYLAGSGGNDSLSGLAGNDTLEGGEGNDSLLGGAGSDLLLDGAGDDLVQGGEGDDIFLKGAGQDSFEGGAGSDLLIWDVTTAGLSAGSVIEVNLQQGQGGLSGATARDSYQGIEAVTVTSGTLAVLLTGDAQANELISDAGNDTLGGGAGNDSLDAGAGDDLAFAGAGDDLLIGGAGRDQLYGGADNDTLLGGDGDDILGGAAGNDSFDGGAGAGEIWTSRGDDTAQGGDGNDTLGGFDGNDSLSGGAGNDALWGARDNDTLIGGDGDDTLGGSLGNDNLDGGAGADELWGADGTDTLSGGAGNDQIGTGIGNDVASGGAGNDTVSGGLGNDTLFGDGDDDLLFGAAGDDALNGGTGNDTIYGGAGADTFIFDLGGGADQIFVSLAEDRVLLDDSLWSGPRSEAQVIADFGGALGADYVFDFGADSLTLVGQAGATQAQLEALIVLL